MFTLFFQSGDVQNFDEASRSDTKAFAQFHRGMLDRGVYLPPSQFEAAFLSAEHSDDDIDRTITAVREIFQDFRS